MADTYCRAVLRVVIAQLSQAVGFDSINLSALDVLTDVLERYLLVLGKTVHDFSEQCGQTNPHLSDVDFALRHLHVSVADIIEYMQQMEPIKFSQKVSKFPAPKSSNLQFPSGNNPDDFNRDESVPLYMPSFLITAKETTQKLEETAESQGNQQGKPGTFVIAGKHSKDLSSDEDDYSAGDVSNDEYMSDDSLAHNPIKSRHLTKPEDIPTIEGTAPSSMISMPSVTDLEDLRGSSPSRHSVYEENFDDHAGNPIKIKKTLSQSRKLSQAEDNVPWLPNPPSENRNPPALQKSNAWSSQSKKHKVDEMKKWPPEKIHDKYNSDWLQGGAASPVHLSKPSTPDGSFAVAKNEKSSWYDNDRRQSSGGNQKSFSKSKSDQVSPRESKNESSKSSSLQNFNQKHSIKASSERKQTHGKFYKTSKNAFGKKNENADEPIKARIEAVEKLILSPPVPPYVPSSPSSMKQKLSKHSSPKSPVRTSIEKADKLLKHPPVGNFPLSRESSPAPSKSTKILEKQKEEQIDRSGNFASSESMYDAIDAVINRATEESLKKDEEARKQAEEAELMKFSHLVEDSSSSDSEPDVSHKVKQLLQLEERGLQETQPPTPGSSPPSHTPSSTNTLQSFAIDEEEEDVVVDSEDEPDTPNLSIYPPPPPKITPKHPTDFAAKSSTDKHGKKEKHKKDKSRKTSRENESKKSSHKLHLSSKSKKEKYSPKPTHSFVTTETISEKPVKVKVKFKKHYVQEEPQLFEVDPDRDRIRSSKSKEEKHKSKEEKHHKSKEHKKSLSVKPFSDVRPQDQSVEKIILKKSKSGDAKVVKPKVKEITRSPSPPSPIRSNLPVPKLSAAVPVLNVAVVSKEKEKKKSKKEKKKKKERSQEREKHYEKQRLSSRDSFYESEKPKPWEDRSISRKMSKEVESPLVPKLTLKMGADEKKFVIKGNDINPAKSSSKKRSHSSVMESTIPAKERKVSVESAKTDYESPSSAVERKVITQTISAGPVGVYEDEEGNKIWICPGCNKPDDGSPMIGCDTCDDWYHWPCVNITQEPDDENWYCPRCTKRQQHQGSKAKSGKKKKKK